MVPEAYKSFHAKVALPKSSVLSVSEIKLVLMATPLKLVKPVVAPATIQVPEASRKQPPFNCKPLAKVEVTEFEVTFKTFTVRPPEKLEVAEPVKTTVPEEAMPPEESMYSVPEAVVEVLPKAKALPRDRVLETLSAPVNKLMPLKELAPLNDLLPETV